MRRLGILLTAVSTVAACSGGVDSIGVIASTERSVGVGHQRVLVAVVDLETNEYLATEDIAPVATLRDGIGSPLGEYTGEFVWTIPDVRGLYAFEVEIPGANTYQLTIDAGQLGELGPLGLVAVDDPIQVAPGETAPLSETRTLDDTAIEDITSDPDPDEAFYTMTVAEAVRSGPSVIVFATPVWCSSQACGPMLDQVKAVAPDFPQLNFVHVEVYENIHVNDPADLVLVPAISEWGIPSEPWLYVTDAAGVVSSAFEGAVSEDELQAALGSVSG